MIQYNSLAKKQCFRSDLNSGRSTHTNNCLNGLQHGFLTVPQEYNLRTQNYLSLAVNLQTHYNLTIRPPGLSHKRTQPASVTCWPCINSNILHRRCVLAVIPLSPDPLYSVPSDIMPLESRAQVCYGILQIFPWINRILTKTLTCVLSMTTMRFPLWSSNE